MRSRINDAAGRAAEAQALAHYIQSGYALRDHRWRGQGGELDLVLEAPDAPGGIVVVEVKASKTHAAAAQRLQARQMARIWAATEEYLGTCPDGQLTDIRFDVALVDATGRVDVVENALMN
ncbi:MAG: YraN family protein [Shimia sp.]